MTLVVLGLALGACDSCSKSSTVLATDAALPTADASPINVTTLPTASIAAMVNPDHLPSYVGPTGSVEGTIMVSGPRALPTTERFDRCPDAVTMYGKQFREGDPEAKSTSPRWLADAVVAITGYGGFFIPEKDEAEELSIIGCGYAKRTVTMTFGQRLDVKNLTKDFWTPLLSPAPTAVMMMAAPGGDPVRLYPKKPGHYLLVDHDRKYAVADLYAFLHPLHVSTGVLGKYRIDGIPVGKVKVNASHPRVPSADASAEVEIQPNVVQKVDLELVHKPPVVPDGGASDSGAYYPPVH